MPCSPYHRPQCDSELPPPGERVPGSERRGNGTLHAGLSVPEKNWKRGRVTPYPSVTIKSNEAAVTSSQAQSSTTRISLAMSALQPGRAHGGAEREAPSAPGSLVSERVRTAMPEALTPPSWALANTPASVC